MQQSSIILIHLQLQTSSQLRRSRAYQSRKFLFSFNFICIIRDYQEIHESKIDFKTIKLHEQSESARILNQRGSNYNTRHASVIS